MTPPVAPFADEFTCGEWNVQPQLNRIVRGDETVHLQPRVMDVLVYLSARPGRVVSKADLVDALWPEEFVSDAVLNRALCELRRVLDDDPRAPRFIETIPKRGYRIVAEVVIRGERPAMACWTPPTAAPEGGVALEPAQRVLGPGVRGYLVCGRSEAALSFGEHLVGRGQEASLFIRHSQVSRCHARVRLSDEGTFIEDLGSTNGTFVRGQRISGPVRLEDGDPIRLGSLELVYRDAGQLSTRS
jgi:DNA-binding winged helix-turn-helix (wHTH) protein